MIKSQADPETTQLSRAAGAEKGSPLRPAQEGGLSKTLLTARPAPEEDMSKTARAPANPSPGWVGCLGSRPSKWEGAEE